MPNSTIYNTVATHGLPGSALDDFPYISPTACRHAQTGAIGIRWEGAYDAVKYFGFRFTDAQDLQKLQADLPAAKKPVIARAIELLATAKTQDARTLPVFQPKAESTSAPRLKCL